MSKTTYIFLAFHGPKMFVMFAFSVNVHINARTKTSQTPLKLINEKRSAIRGIIISITIIDECICNYQNDKAEKPCHWENPYKCLV